MRRKWKIKIGIIMMKKSLTLNMDDENRNQWCRIGVNYQILTSLARTEGKW